MPNVFFGLLTDFNQFCQICSLFMRLYEIFLSDYHVICKINSLLMSLYKIILFWILVYLGLPLWFWQLDYKGSLWIYLRLFCMEIFDVHSNIFHHIRKAFWYYLFKCSLSHSLCPFVADYHKANAGMFNGFI